MYISPEDFEVIKKMLEHVSPSSVIKPMTLVFKTPAQSLRDTADAIEKKDADIAAFITLINRLEHES